MTLFAAAVAWLICAGAHALGVPVALAVPVVAVPTAVLPAGTRRHRAVHIAVALAVVAIAILRLDRGQALPTDSVGRHTEQSVRLLVRADADGEVHPTYVSATAVALARAGNDDWLPASGRLSLLLPATAAIRGGDELDLIGWLAPAGGNNAGYATWLSRQGIVATLAFPRLAVLRRGGGSWLTARWQAFRREAMRGLERTLPPEETALGSSLLFGNRHALPPEFTADLLGSGLSHIAVVSAFNLMLLYGTVVALLAPVIGRRRAVILAATLAVAYGALAGDSATLRRGELLVGLLALATYCGRPYSRVSLLVLAAAAMTVTDPTLVSDAGFQLTFAAAAGITVLAPLLTAVAEHVLGGDDGLASVPARARAPLEATIISIAVTLAIVPVSMNAFGSVSFSGIAANAAVNPLLPLATLLALLTGLLGGLLGVAAIGAPLWLALRYVEGVAHLAAHAPAAAVRLPLPALPFALCWYGALLAILLTLGRRNLVARLRSAGRSHSRHRRPRPAARSAFPARTLLVPAAALCALLIVSPAIAAALRPGTPGTSVLWLDGADGDAALVTGRNGVRILVTSSQAPLALAQAIQRSTGRAAGVDLVVATQAGSGADGWREVALTVHAGGVMIPAESARTAAGDLPSSATPPRDIMNLRGRAEIQLGGGDRLDIVANGRDALARVAIGHYALLMTGGRFAGVLTRWQQPAVADLIVLPEHSAGGAYRELLDAAPGAIVLSGRATEATTSDVTFPGSRVLRAAAVRGLRVSLQSGRLRVEYRDR